MSVNNDNSRRKFIRNSALALGSVAILPDSIFAAESTARVLDSNNVFKTGFEQTPLAYAYGDLEQSIDAMTMEIHYSKHAAAYAKALNEAAVAEKIDTKKPLEDVLQKISKYSVKARNNGGGHFNHEMFWKSLSPKSTGKPSGKLLAAIEKDFSSFDAFKTQFGEAGKTRFGSGWAWLVVAPGKKLTIGSTPNQDNPLMDVSELKGIPLLGLDVWEHAYYLKYQNKRPEYIENFWKVVNWDAVQARFEGA
ncbi:MAG: superoxide dismutase [Chitinophagaceae bacterium]|nr:MAG: superoxide dismutase [Chitinophagaceae bacterium]